MNRDDIIKMATEVWETPKWTEIQISRLERFFNMAQVAERETISEEWWMCVQSDLENGVKSLNEAATEKWQKEYPEISKFAAWLEARGNQ